MLLRRIHLYLHREGVVLAENVLHRIDVVLSHVSQTAGLVVPVAAESLVNTMRIVRLVRSRPEPHVVVKFSRNRLRHKIFLSCPEEFPGKARGSGDPHGQWPAQKPALHEFLKRLHRCSKAVERVLETEPGVQTEDTAVLVDRLHNFLPLADCPCHRLLAEYVLTGAAGLDGHDSVPV